MRLATFTHTRSRRLGIVTAGGVIDLAQAAPELPRDMVAFLALGTPAWEAARAAATAAPHFALADVHLDATVPRPGKLLCIAVNYAAHAAEFDKSTANFPSFFNKQQTSVNGPYDPVHVPKVSPFLDYEGELGMVIGRRCRHVPKARALEVVAGFLILNDISVRDWQVRAQTNMTLGKSFDTSAPMGPWLVTPDEIADPQALRITTRVNGEVRQDASTSEMVFNCRDQIEWLSKAMTLEPGDVISTGTPSGVGAAMNPKRFLKAGDIVRVEIDTIGHIENSVIKEPADTACI